MKSTWKIWSTLVLVVLGVFFAINTTSAFGQEATLKPEVEPALLEQMRSSEVTGYMIYFREKADLSAAYSMNWEARGQYVVNTLQETASRSQANVVHYLNVQKVDYQAFWIDNVIVVNAFSQDTFEGLMAFEEIEFLRARRTMSVIEPIVESAPASMLAVEPNLSQVSAPDVWGLGITGSGFIVANIDTGVRSTHDALVRQYRGTASGSHDYNWLGAAGGSPTPVDDHGHGTHTMGTMVGEDVSQTNQVGIAPGAQWIACDGCEGSDCPGAALLTCAQWIAAPYPVGDPGSPDPAMRPHAVNNSWGDCDTTYDNWYQGSVDAWHAAGIYPVFSNGNASNCGYSYPPGLNTVGNPARYGNVTGVGSTGESNGMYATHSNWGPTDNLDTVNPKPGAADLKPQVLAPGVSIRSSTPGSDSEYQDGWTGTSMSAPHVTGLVALIWNAAPCLVGDYATTETIMEDTATPIPYDDGTGGGAHVPNYATGWGEINALAAVGMAQTMCGGGTLTGQVTEGTVLEAPGDPIPGTLISAESVSDTYQTTSDANGLYVMDLITGTYDVTASAFGFVPDTVTGITVTGDMTVTLDFALTPAPSHLVEGYVYDANTYWPLYANIDIDGYPGDPIWTDPVSGYYSITLPEGITYTFNVNAWVPGYLPGGGDVGPLTGDTMADFGLDADAV
ncbi:MAG: S8 family serine peptidase, partial [Gammaproteobacteria bacterium]|nr:S8 family serine peptidase [Gammaproteobacteria bacterium]